MIWLLLWALMLSPSESAEVAGRVGHVAPGHLRRIGWRESRLQRVGVHQGDAGLGGRAWARSVQRGRLQPSWCPWHALGPDPSVWSTRGAWGHMAAYAVSYLGCVPPWVLDVPLVSAWVSVLRYRAAQRQDAPRALRAWAEVAHG